jgi:steroid 5-alpha reductase family enzyme
MDAMKHLLRFATVSSEQAWLDMQQFSNCIMNRTVTGDSFAQCYYKSEPLAVGYAGCVVLIAYCFIWSIIGNNCSKVDQIWSIAPVLYCWHFYVHYVGNHSGEIHAPLLLLCVLTTLWGTRLTFNFWRKGGYGTFFVHEEDYRWPILRAKMHPLVFLLFNFSFIAIYQNLLLFWIAVPAFEVMKASPALRSYDVAVGGAFAAMLLVETVADEQHWVFQSIKHSLTSAERSRHVNPEIRQGFYQSGLFKFSRHPNYFAEQSMWVIVYLFSLCGAWYADAAATAPCVSPASCSYLNWTVIGCVQLILLFQGSMTFGESITLAKYPEYAAYQRTTSGCIPLPPFGHKKTA